MLKKPLCFFRLRSRGSLHPRGCMQACESTLFQQPVVGSRSRDVRRNPKYAVQTPMTDRLVLCIRYAMLTALWAGGAVLPMPAQALEPSQPVTGRAALLHIEALSEDIGSRTAGSPNEQSAAAYIESAFREAGYDPLIQRFFLFGGSGAESANVVATKMGQSRREIIVGAHYDSQRRGPGADDNASGVGVLLEVASALKDVPVPYSLRFVAFGAEERGIRGARYFVSTMDQAAIRNTVAMINLDSVTAGDVPYVYGSEGAAGRIRDWAIARAAALDFDLRTQDGSNPEYPAGTTCACSDHAPFEEAGIQYAYFESTNWALGDKDGYTQVDPAYGERGYIWHTPFDTLEYLRMTFPGRVEERLALFSRMLYAILTEYTE